MKNHYFLAVLCITLRLPFLMAQDSSTIYFKNASFERTDYSFLLSKDSLGWIDCGFFMEEMPSFQPGTHEVEERAQHLKTYLSLLVRDNHTWDAVGQRLVRPLIAGKCYRFTLQLSKAEQYVTRSRSTGNKVNYRNPVRLLVWGSHGFCKAGQLLAKTELVKNNNWETYSFVFQPNSDITHLTLQAYYLNPMAQAYNGNILLDNASEIVAIDCQEVAIPVPDENLVELRPRSLSELESFISLHGEKILFNESSDKLTAYKEKQLYDAIDWSQIYFAVIGKSLRYFPSHQLIIALKGKSPRKIQRRIEFLQAFLNQCGVPTDAYRCMIYPTNAEDLNWLTFNKDLAFRLESRTADKVHKTSSK